ncbi:hypothetical protein [Clostridium butyricum]|uniref:hypothetical protein n=1 Tax=Clostridium butyricum TaxID=1492 RepID=UPI0005C23997|nr:hypothetical protein [Clostridium butyricum]KIU07775.1 hypothetical protein SC08_Contig83orf01697 [Clostridium butyricum]MBA8967606.1 hypothetical protein [Clostridium butyricum]MBA8971327.1 hypothetical protein [Clostridium butyricum]MBC2429389.1 hypothetical protein [Clostridium butyricum]NOW36807.1 hypothetical protein [Clostridium butyricum]
MKIEAKISDSFWFYKVVGQELIAKSLIEELLDIRIESIRKIEMKNAIRFEIIRNSEELKYDVEIHKVNNIKEVGKKFRYYQEIKYLKDDEYCEHYKKDYIIFLCETDCFKRRFPIYTFENRAAENMEVTLDDGTYKIILNIDYAEENKKMVSNDIAEFLSYMKNGIVGEDSCELVKNINKEFKKLKHDKIVKHEYLCYLSKKYNI